MSCSKEKLQNKKLNIEIKNGNKHIIDLTLFAAIVQFIYLLCSTIRKKIVFFQVKAPHRKGKYKNCQGMKQMTHTQ